MDHDYMHADEIFALAAELAEGHTHQDIADALGVGRTSITRMLAGHHKLLTLAMRWVDHAHPDGPIFGAADGRPTAYYRADAVEDAHA